MPLLKTKRWDRRSIQYHYDVSNEFYACFLDPRMVYTCAYYRHPDGELAEAQEDKLDLICRKLRLQPGERLLDIGCGWGSLVMWAAERYGVEARGVTLSRAQATWAQEAIRRAGLSHVARVEELDYRDLSSDVRFDKIAAVGVVEHLRIDGTPAYLRRVHDLLRPGGLFLNHGITRDKHWRPTSLTEFLNRHVFPNAEQDDVSHFLDSVERARFEIVDVENLRAHYARTTHQWVERLQANAIRAREVVDERTYRIWVAYLASASVAFSSGSIGLYQTVVRRPDPTEAARPTTREDIYVPRVVEGERTVGVGRRR
ncbi:MAG TPA: class I SAM-dependent methyltransferase [Candidatus Binatia bacterium]|jgi:cyclopropane-fatty-acyl-phospholipid synthase|nr:class I SAM-dependent methyltransferase [Candidatus Binatia bacterium]